ncbi:hypothetical protein [Phocaeicola vulgatus]|uniref:hypothetical protein n=1 Tax=Phocaeicola vulgatus TaxID=821 RepID=UPI00125CABAE|nr:hypothetical protein [Phocaeicola vulgatus]KAB5456286.1 hypothetical protein F9001_04440 [Phocaeicola vulgatus]
MEPVELTIITRNKTKEGLAEINKDLDKTGRTVEEVAANFKARMKEQADAVKQVEKDIASLEKQLGKVAPGKAKMELTAELNAAKKVLAEEKGELALLEKQVEQSAQKHIMLRTEIRNLKEQMAGMTEGTAEYAAAMERLGRMQDRMGDINTQGRIFSDDNKNIKATMNAISGLTGVMTAGVGVASLFGMEEEKLAKIQTKLQAVMAITMGVQQVANTLNKDSYFTHVLLTKGKDMLTMANTRLAVSLGISKIAAQALMATMTLGLSVAITALIVLWNKYTKNAEREQRALNAEIEKTKTSIEQIANDVDFEVRIAEAAGKSKKELMDLRKEAVKTALSLADLNFDNVNARYFDGKATKEQVEEARKVSQQAWDNYNKVMQDAIVYDTEQRNPKKKNGSPTSDKTSTANKLADAELKALQKIEDMTIALMEEGEEKKKALARKQFDDELARINKEESERLKALQEAQKNGFKATPEQVNAVSGQAKQQRLLASEQYIKDYYALEKEYSDKSKKLKDDEAQSWIDYNKEFGDYQEKRAAIAQDYENKIARAKTGGEKASLKKNEEKAIAELDKSMLEKSDLWVRLFGDAEKHTLSYIQKTIEETRQLLDYINQVKGAKLPTGITEDFAKSLKPNELKAIMDALIKQRDTLNKRNPFQQLIQGFKDLNAAGADTEKQFEATQGIIEGMNGAASIIRQAGDAMESLGVKSDSAMKKTADVLSSTASMASTGASIAGPWGAVIGGAIGLASGLVGVFGADYSGYNAMVAKYDVLLDVWDQLLDKKKAYIKESYASEAVKAGEEALGLLDAEKEVNKRLGESRLSSGSSVGSHSLWYRMWKGSYKYEGRNWRDVAGEISKSLGGIKFGSMNDMLDMTGDQLEWIKTQYSGLWSVMDGDFRQYLDNIIEYGEAEKEIIESVKEQITGISLSEFENSYLSMMMDLDSTNEDFADNLEKYLQTSIFRSLIAEKYKGQIQSLYDSFYESGKDGLTQTEVENLRKQQQELADAMLADRENMMKAFGWSADDTASSSSQSGRAGAVTTITEETGGKIEGTLNVMTNHLIEMDDNIKDISKNSYESIGLLSKIAENTACLPAMAEVLERMDINGTRVKII